jgi:DNA-directed RNA polymerase subunit beta'
MVRLRLGPTDERATRLFDPDRIRAWSGGSVTRPETLDWHTLTPVEGGLFCQRIFGPTGRHQRLGHLELAAPILDPRLTTGPRSPLALLLDLAPDQLPTILHDAAEGHGNTVSHLRQMLSCLRLDQLGDDLRAALRSAPRARRAALRERLWIVEVFRAAAAQPEWLVLTVLPVLPPSVRPIVERDDGKLLVSTLNDLYRRVINRNWRLGRLAELPAPDQILRRERHLLQQTIGALLEGWHKQSLPGPDGRPRGFPREHIRRWWP